MPTQCGYSSDHPIAKPEIGKVGVPINSLDDFKILFDQIPLGEMNTSMTINGTSMWLLSLYVALADELGVPQSKLEGTTQNDIIKEYLAHGTYIFLPNILFASLWICMSMRLEMCQNGTHLIFVPTIYKKQEQLLSGIGICTCKPMAILDAIKERNCFTEEEFEKM